MFIYVRFPLNLFSLNCLKVISALMYEMFNFFFVFDFFFYRICHGMNIALFSNQHFLLGMLCLLIYCMLYVFIICYICFYYMLYMFSYVYIYIYICCIYTYIYLCVYMIRRRLSCQESRKLPTRLSSTFSTPQIHKSIGAVFASPPQFPTVPRQTSFRYHI